MMQSSAEDRIADLRASLSTTACSARRRSISWPMRSAAASSQRAACRRPGTTRSSEHSCTTASTSPPAWIGNANEPQAASGQRRRVHTTSSPSTDVPVGVPRVPDVAGDALPGPRPGRVHGLTKLPGRRRDPHRDRIQRLALDLPVHRRPRRSKVVPSASTSGSATSSSRSAPASARATSAGSPSAARCAGRSVMSSPMLVAPTIRPSRSRMHGVVPGDVEDLAGSRVRIQFSS